MIYQKTSPLSNGATIPRLGLGTWLLSDAQAKQAVIDAVRLGYRHIDTAQAYGNEAGVGEGVRACGVSREDLFITTNDILVEAYSPIAHGAVLGNPQIRAMADKYGVSVAQLCLRYDLQLGTVVLPKTANPAHMENNGALDFVISDEDMAALKAMDPIQDYGEHSFFPVFGGKL